MRLVIYKTKIEKAEISNIKYEEISDTFSGKNFDKTFRDER